MSAVAQNLITAEEFWRMPETHTKRELVRGKIVETVPPNGRHGIIASEIDYQAVMGKARQARCCWR